MSGMKPSDYYPQNATAGMLPQGYGHGAEPTIETESLMTKATRVMELASDLAQQCEVVTAIVARPGSPLGTRIERLSDRPSNPPDHIVFILERIEQSLRAAAQNVRMTESALRG